MWSAAHCSSPGSHLGYPILGRGRKSALFYLTVALRSQSSDIGNSGMPKRSHKVLPLSGKMKVLDLIREGKKLYAEFAKICCKDTPYIHEIVKKICASLAATPQIANVLTIG